MVAYTSPDCLPYFECDDSVCLNTGTQCDPSTVWCDMTAILEARMNSFDSIASRTATQVPFFKVARRAEQLIDDSDFGEPYGMVIEWDTILADNDNMVNLDADNRGAVITRPGLWQFELYLVGHPPITVNNTLLGKIRVNEISQAGGSGVWRLPGIEAYLRAGVMVPLSAATLNTNGTTLINCRAEFSGAAAPDDIVHVIYAELTGYWMGDAA